MWTTYKLLFVMFAVRDQQEERHRAEQAATTAGGCAFGERGDGDSAAQEAPGGRQ